MACTSNPHFCTVDDIIITITCSMGLACRKVGACPRFGDCVGGECAFFSHFSEPDVLLLIRCPGNDRSASQRRSVGCCGKTRVAPCKLFIHDDIFHRTEARSTVFFRYVEVEQTHFMGCLDGFLGIGGCCIPMLRMRADFIHCKLVSKFLEHFLHFIKLEVDHAYGRRPPFMSPLFQENVMTPRR